VERSDAKVMAGLEWSNDYVDTLTKRELEMFKLVGLGMTNVEISQKMGVKPSTIRTWAKSVHDKLYLAGRARLAIASSRMFYKG
jgi:DNA-binding CsgD family transcriptional regulator